MIAECPHCGKVCRCDLHLDVTTGKQSTWWQLQNERVSWIEYVRLLEKQIASMWGLHIAHNITRIGSDEDIRRGTELRRALGLEVDGEDDKR